MIKVSVIIPVYNTKEYLEECINSVLNQTIEGIEIVCIDDCSTDGSSEILGHYQKKGLIKVYKNKNNSGLSQSRNNGVAYAHGEFLIFLDSDDMLHRNALEDLYVKADKDKADVVFYNFDSIADGCIIPEGELRYCSEGKYTGIMTGGEFLNASFEYKDERIPACLQFWRREKYNEYNMHFSKGILHEDILFTFTTFVRAQRVSFLNEQLYIYRRRAESITTATRDERYIRSVIYIYRSVENLIMEYTGNDGIVAASAYYLDNIKWLLQKYISEVGLKDKDLKKMWGGDSVVYRSYRSICGLIEIADREIGSERKKLIVYGAGKIANYCIPKLKAADVNIFGIAVSNINNNPEYFHGIKVRTIDEYIDIKDDCIVLVCIGAGEQWKVLDKLNEMGFYDCRV